MTAPVWALCCLLAAAPPGASLVDRLTVLARLGGRAVQEPAAADPLPGEPVAAAATLGLLLVEAPGTLDEVLAGGLPVLLALRAPGGYLVLAGGDDQWLQVVHGGGLLVDVRARNDVTAAFGGRAWRLATAAGTVTTITDLPGEPPLTVPVAIPGG